MGRTQLIESQVEEGVISLMVTPRSAASDCEIPGVARLQAVYLEWYMWMTGQHVAKVRPQVQIHIKYNTFCLDISVGLSL